MTKSSQFAHCLHSLGCTSTANIILQPPCVHLYAVLMLVLCLWLFKRKTLFLFFFAVKKSLNCVIKKKSRKKVSSPCRSCQNVFFNRGQKNLKKNLFSIFLIFWASEQFKKQGKKVDSKTLVLSTLILPVSVEFLCSTLQNCTRT